MTFSPSGQQFELSVDDQHVTIVEAGGGIRSYRVGDRDVLQPYAMDQICDGAHGAPLIPRPVVLVRVAPALPGHPLQTAYDDNQ